MHNLELFTTTMPDDERRQHPSTPRRTFSSVPGHRTGLDVVGVIWEGELLVHIGDACLSRETAAALAVHLTALTSASTA